MSDERKVLTLRYQFNIIMIFWIVKGVHTLVKNAMDASYVHPNPKSNAELLTTLEMELILAFGENAKYHTSNIVITVSEQPKSGRWD